MAEENTTKPLLSNAWYNRIKFVALILLPALGTAYFSLAGIWNLPSADKVTGTVTVIVTLLGVLLQVSTVKYNNSDAKYDAAIVKVPGPNGEPMYALEYETREQRLEALSKDSLLLKVKS